MFTPPCLAPKQCCNTPTPCQVEFRDSDTVSSNPSLELSVSQRKNSKERQTETERDALKEEKGLIVTMWSCCCLM